MMKNILNVRYKACKYFARKNNNKANLFGKFVDEYGKTKLTKEEMKLNEKNLEVLSY
jgi:hypothetical protein